MSSRQRWGLLLAACLAISSVEASTFLADNLVKSKSGTAKVQGTGASTTDYHQTEIACLTQQASRNCGYTGCPVWQQFEQCNSEVCERCNPDSISHANVATWTPVSLRGLSHCLGNRWPQRQLLCTPLAPVVQSTADQRHNLGPVGVIDGVVIKNVPAHLQMPKCILNDSPCANDGCIECLLPHANWNCVTLHDAAI